MWGPGPWMGPMWGFWWIFPVVGLLICLVVAFGMMRMMSGGGVTRPRADDREDIAALRREIQELRDEMKRQAAGR